MPKRGETVATAQPNSSKRSGQAMLRKPRKPCIANEAKVHIAIANTMHSMM